MLSTDRSPDRQRPLRLHRAVPLAAVEAAAGRLPLRAAPAHTAPVVGHAPDGALLHVCSRCGGWSAVRHGGRAGFVCDDEIVLLY
ncbi:MAG: hypothetical protein Q4D31_03720 [Eubacteriales bacterium]|nr:hypothetical protein [Eubacteriales bacterium]